MNSNQHGDGNVLQNHGNGEGEEGSDDGQIPHNEIPVGIIPMTEADEDNPDLFSHLESEDTVADAVQEQSAGRLREPDATDGNINIPLDNAIQLAVTAKDENVSSDDQLAGSVDDTASIPDDTPSVRGSILSSPGSRTPSISSPARRRSPSSPHRPFDRRFQSRISSSSLLNSRSASPAFLNVHSRQSSVGSLAVPTASEVDESEAPWEAIRWVRLKKITGQIFSEVGKRNFGSPTCIVVTDHIVIGTSRGMVLVFDHQQNHKAIIGAGTKAIESGSITSLAISADHTTIAAGHATGHIFTWEIAKSARPFLHILPTDASQSQARRIDGHVAGSSVLHIGFLGYRHTALVSADDKGMAFSHLATRGMGSVGRVVRTTRILGRYPEVVVRSSKPLKKSSVLAFSPLPLGNVEQRTDTLGLVAMMTPYLLVIVSTTPIAQTQHKAARPKEVIAHSAMTAALAWFPAIKLKGKDSETSRPKLAYAWSNILTILEIHELVPEEDTEKEKPPELQFPSRSRFVAEEAIVAVQWLSRSILAVLTITQQLIIIEDPSMTVTDSFDILPKNVYHVDLYSQQLHSIIESLDEEDISMHGVVADAFHMSFRAYKGRLFLLGNNDLWWGSLSNWADRLLALMNIGDFIGAIRLATRYYAGHGEKVTIGLPEDDSTRAEMVGEKLIEMMNASLKYAFGKNQHARTDPIDQSQMAELAEACMVACIAANETGFLFDEVFSWYDDHGKGSVFVDVLESFVLDGRLISLPPPVVKTLIDHFSTTHAPSKLEELICLLDTSTMDIDQVTSLCKKYNLYDAYIYVWNNSLHDYVTPLEELLQLASESREMNGHADLSKPRDDTAQKMFPYLSFILTGRTYPTGMMVDGEIADIAKSQIYGYLFSGMHVSESRVGRSRGQGGKPDLPYGSLRKVLYFDTPSFISALNEAFEDSFLNSGDEDGVSGSLPQPISTLQRTIYNRQFIVRIMLEVMSSGFEKNDTIYLDMFVARNLPKYPQYLLLSGTTLQEIFARLCDYPDESMREDAQLSVEYLLSVHSASNLLTLVPLLREAQFYRVLKTVFRQEHQYADMVSTYFDEPDGQTEVFPVLLELLRSGSNIPDLQRNKVMEVIEAHLLDLTNVDVRKTATTFDIVAAHLHSAVLEILTHDSFAQFEYLNSILEPEDSVHNQEKRSSSMIEQYVRLMCGFHPEHVPEYVETIKEGDLRLSEVLPIMENSGIIDAAVILQARSGKVKDAMTRLTRHLATLKSMLQGLLASVVDVSDSVSTNESIVDLLSSIEKYAKVGIWLCQGQSKILQRSKPLVKSPKRSASIKQPLSQEENFWLDLIVAVVAIARDTAYKPAEKETAPAMDDMDEVTSSLRSLIQQVFTALLTSTTSARDSSSAGNDFTFLRILRAFLSYEAEAAPSLSELRNVIRSIFSAYAHEVSLLSLSNSMLDKDVFVKVSHVSQLRQQGWRPRGQICEICRRRVWGPGLGSQVWAAWKQKEEARATRRHPPLDTPVEENTSRSKGKAAAKVSQNITAEEESSGSADIHRHELGPIVVYSCRHVYHTKCLRTGLTDDEEVAKVGTVDENLRVCPACA